MMMMDEWKMMMMMFVMMIGDDNDFVDFMFKCGTFDDDDVNGEVN